MDTKAMVQSWPMKGRSPVPPQGHLTQDGGSPRGAELGRPASPSPISQPRQPKGTQGLCVCQAPMCSCLYSGEKRVPPGQFPLVSPHGPQQGWTSSGLATPYPVAGPPWAPRAEEDFGGTFSPLRPFRPLGPACPGDP